MRHSTQNRLRNRWKRIGFGLLGVVIALTFAACNPFKPSSPDTTQPESDLPPLKPFPEVVALETPELPDWIEQISPMDQVDSLAQIRIRFESPLIPLESLESSERQAVLDKFELVPELPGEFRFLTPRMVGFQGDRALPKATRYQVTLKSGLSDLENHQLEQDLAWTFNTEPIELSGLPGYASEATQVFAATALEPALEFTANTALDTDSIEKAVRLTRAGSDRAIAVTAALVEAPENDFQPDPSPAEQFNPDSHPKRYSITPKRSLKKATDYTLAFTPGIKPAQGNLASAEEYERQFSTYAPLAFEKISAAGGRGQGGAYGRFENGIGILNFNNGLVAESALEEITVDPAPKESPQLLRAYDEDRTVTLNPWALEPATEYTFTLGAGLTDVYGQTLGKTEKVTYKTGDISPELWAPSGLNIFPTNQNLQLNVSTVNLPESYKAAFTLVEPTDLVYADSAYPREDRSLLPEPSQWESLTVKNEKNVVEENAIPLAEKLPSKTGMLAYGVQAKTVKTDDRWQEPSYYGLVQLTNLGVFSQWFPESGVVRVHHLSDGSAAIADIDIYKSQLDSETVGNPTPCATGKTDQEGVLRLNAAALKQCMAGASRFAQPPELLAIARENEDWAFVRTQPYSGSYGFGIYADWEGNQPLSRGAVFSDRKLYQPGEKAWFTGVADYLENGVLKQDKQVAYAVTVENPDGEKIDLGQQTTNEFGTFSVAWDVGAQQPLGNYVISAKNERGVEIRGDFRVAEFNPPNFKVDLELDKTVVEANQTVEAKAQSNYLFGPAVQDADVAYYVTRTATDFVPEGWDKFTFGRRWDWPEERPEISVDVLQTTETLSAEGGSELSIEVDADVPYPLSYRVDAEVSDVSNLAVSASASFTALPSDRLIGLQADFVATAGEAFPVQVIVSDADGSAIANQRVKLELQKATYSRVTEVIEGSRIPVDQVEYETVAEATVRSKKTAQTAELTPPESGSYRIRANFADADTTNANGPVAATDLRLWATGGTPVYWGARYNNNRLSVQLDKDSYEVGETATALIQSPYPEADLFFSVIRHDTIYQTLQKVEGGAPQIQFTVTPEMLPNAAVEAVLVRQGEALEDLENPADLENLSSVGFEPFETSLENKYLEVDISPQQSTLKPGEKETLALSLKDADDRPVSGQFTVMVVNDAVLQLSGYRPPDLVEMVYAEQPISTRFADNRKDVAITPLTSPLAKGWGYGGGDSSGAASTRLRENFQALAYFSGSVLADDNGQAQVSFELPDDLTTWRVMAVATDGELNFGQGEAMFVTTQPLITNPLLPQFMRQGDRAEIGLSITNTTGKNGNLEIVGNLGDRVSAEDEDRLTHRLRGSSGTDAYRLTVVADQSGESDVEFRTDLGGTGDAFKVPLTVKALEITEQVVAAGTTTDSVSIPLRVGSEVNSDVGGLQISLASNLLSNLQMPAAQTLQEDYFPSLETLASRIAISAQLKVLSQKYAQSITDVNLNSVVATALEDLEKLQQPDGGFTAWPSSRLSGKESDPFVTPYAVSALSQAKTAGFAVNETLLTQGKNYLDSILADPGQYSYCQNANCKNRVRLETLNALADTGDVRNQYVSWLYEQREKFSLLDQIKLARHLSRLSDWEAEAKTMASQIQELIYETGRGATLNTQNNWSRRWYWLSSQTAAQAQALQLFIAQDSRPELLSRLVQSLLSQRREGTWAGSYNNTQALTALVDYAQRLPNPPNFETTVQVDGQTVSTNAFRGYEVASAEVTVSMSELAEGESELQLQKEGEGELHYVSAYRYRPEGNPPGRLNGLRVTREVRSAGQDEVLSRFGLQSAEGPISLPVGQVFDVGLEIIVDRPVDHVIITDPLPAGLEAVDTTFQTATGAVSAQTDSWEIDYQKSYSDRILAYADRLDAGVYNLHYLVRSVTPGTFGWPGASASLQYAPEEFGRTAAATLKID